MRVATNLSLIEDLKRKESFPMVLKLNALEIIDLHYPEKEWLRIYTDGYQVDEANTAGAAVHCKLFFQCTTLSVNKSNFEGDTEAISVALQQLMYILQTFEKVDILVDKKNSYSSSIFQLSTKIKGDK